MQLQGVEQMTIFVDVLKKLIGEVLTTVSGDLYSKIQTKGYNHELSREQKAEIRRLEEAIIMFVSTNNDDADAKALTRLVTDTCNEIKRIREKHGQAKESGTTVPTLNSLTLRIPEFYEKLVEFKFNLLNKPHRRTPDDVVYFHACCYLGEDVFKPLPTTSVGIRAEKENKLAERLKILNELIKPSYSLQERKERILPILDDLESDNEKVGKGSVPSLPAVSLFGIFSLGAPSDWFAASRGRLGEWIGVSRAEIEKMTPETSDCPRGTAGAAVQSTVVSVKPDDEEEYEEDGDDHSVRSGASNTM